MPVTALGVSRCLGAVLDEAVAARRRQTEVVPRILLRPLYADTEDGFFVALIRTKPSGPARAGNNGKE